MSDLIFQFRALVAKAGALGTGSGCCCTGGKPGCTNPNAKNYDPFATCDDGSCETCCTAELCRLSDDCKGPDCNSLTHPGDNNSGGCCDSGCLPCDCGPPPNNCQYRDCHDSFDNNATGGGNFVATACDNTTIIYYDCYNCPTAVVVTGGP